MKNPRRMGENDHLFVGKRTAYFGKQTFIYSFSIILIEYIDKEFVAKYTKLC